MFIPVYGPYLEYRRLHESNEPFEKKAYDAVVVGAIVGTETIFALSHAAHLAAVGEGSAFTLQAVRRGQNIVRSGPGMATAMVAAGLYGKAVQPAATTESGRYGSVKVTPRLFGGYY